MLHGGIKQLITEYHLLSNNNSYQLDKPKTNFLKKSMSYAGAKCWNDLPLYIKVNEMTIKQFKAMLREKAILTSEV